ncbi:FAD-binding oxidoreductase, partial [Methylobacterium sp. WL122]
MTPSDPVAAFRTALGEGGVLTGSDTARYTRDQRDLMQGEADAVLRPRSVAEVQALVCLAKAEGFGLVPQGGNTGYVGGATPQAGRRQLVVSLERMARIRSVDPLDFTLTCDAGAILADVQDAADAAGLLFPLSYASRGSARIGGALACNSGGIAVLAYGNARDLVLGLEVVLADGRVWNGLKALRKNNAGYDLKHLFVGSEGTLGIITKAVLKLFPKPASRTVGFVGLPSVRVALDLFARLRKRADRDLTAFEFIPPVGLDMVLRHMPGTVRPLAGAHGANVER